MKHYHPTPIDHTSPWATEENFWLEGPNFYRAHMARDARMSFPDTVGTLEGEEIIDALRNAPRWDSVVFSDKSMSVEGDRMILRYHASARRYDMPAYEATCKTVYFRDTGRLLLTEHVQRAA